MFFGSRLFSLLIFTLFLCVPLNAEKSLVSQGQISGVVLDANAIPLHGVSITFKDFSSSHRQHAETDLKGRFGLQVGEAIRFILTFEKSGFMTTDRDFRMDENGNLEIEIVLSSLSEAIIQERVMVVGNPAAVGRITGSAHYLERKTRSDGVFDDVTKFLRRIPGLNIQEEEGFGLRPNIGIRGTGSERSSKITLLEDGILIAPAPYAAPSAYYFPVLGRMKAVEVRKGSSQIKYGPRTTGGVLNLVSIDIPRQFEINGDLTGGGNGTGKAHLTVGNSTDHFGWLLQTYHLFTDGFKELEGGGKTGFKIGDYLGKIRFNTSASSSIYQQIELKIGKTSQKSDETYLGLTNEDFSKNPLRRYQSSQLDRFESEHEQFQVTHLIAPSRRVDITTTAYRNQFHRNWYKLQSVAGVGTSKVLDNPEDYVDEMAILRGSSSTEDELKLRANNRTYYSQGIQSVLGIHFDTSDSTNLLEVGIRYHQDQEDRFQHEDGFQMVEGKMVQSSVGAPGSQSNRISDATALAFFAQDTFRKGRFSVTPGIRLEKINLTRTDFSKTDPGRSTPTGTRENDVFAVVPGMGFRFNWRTDLSLFGGLHKGFSPPGSKKETNPESSFNYEGGIGWTDEGFELQAAGFFNDYDNLLGIDTVSTGGTGEGDLYNSGRARVWGVELSGSADLFVSGFKGIKIPLNFSYTLMNGRFQEDFQSDFKPWGTVISGDYIPYLSSHQLFVGVSMRAPKWRLHLDSSLITPMRTVAGQGNVLSSESTDTSFLLGVTGEYDLMSENQLVTLFVTVQNLTNQTYIAARRPAGVRPGMPRMFMGGIKFNLDRD